MAHRKPKIVRKWLDPTNQYVNSFVMAAVGDEVHSDWDSRALSLTIADCNNQAKLEFGYSTPQDKRKMRTKLSKLQSVIDLIAEALEE